jgi:Tfp pilus assembly protein PilN
MDAVNLLPLEYRDRKRRKRSTEQLDGRRTVRIGGGIALVFLLLLAGLFVHARSLVNSRQDALAKNQSQIAAVQPQVEAIKTAQAAVSGRLAFAQSITNSRMNWDKALDDFARIMPTNSFLSSLQVTAPVSAASATGVSATAPAADGTAVAPAPVGGSTLTLTGSAPSTPGVALVMDRLALLPWLSGITLQSAARDATGSNTFNLVANVSEAH